MEHPVYIYTCYVYMYRSYACNCKHREAPSKFKIWELSTTHTILRKGRRETWDETNFSYFYVLKFTRPDPTLHDLTMTLFDGLYLGQYYR